jgi:cytochrome d ubiquinol oxidase subunit II
MKTEGHIAIQMRRYALYLGVATLAFIGVVSVLTPFQDPVYFERWFEGRSAIWSVIVPLLLAISAYVMFRGLRHGHDVTPFLAALAFFVCSFIGLGISFYPMIVPPSLTIADAAAPDSSLLFALVGAVILIPIILVYTAYAYWVFRGKIDPTEGYH